MAFQRNFRRYKTFKKDIKGLGDYQESIRGFQMVFKAVSRIFKAYQWDFQERGFKVVSKLFRVFQRVSEDF